LLKFNLWHQKCLESFVIFFSFNALSFIDKTSSAHPMDSLVLCWKIGRYRCTLSKKWWFKPNHSYTIVLSPVIAYRNSYALSFLCKTFSRVGLQMQLEVSRHDQFLVRNFLQWNKRKKERIPCLSATLRCGVLSEDSFISPIFSLQLLLVVALDRRPAWLRVLPA
jgi:hypothetical protein